MPDFRIGHGYDAHRLAEGRELVIGGVRVPYERGLLGHSDADVLAHAIIDAMLGALALGDIGKLFPDTDPAYKDADSMLLLRGVAGVVAERGYRLCNLDATVIAQEPKLSPHIGEMRARIAEALATDAANIGVKATTEERMGFTGERLGIAAHAVVLLGSF